MKRTFYMLSLGLVLSSCSEPGDVVTGYARVVMKSTPQPVVVTPAPVAAPAVTSAPAPVTATIETRPAPAPVAAPAAKPAPVVAQNQPVISEPAPVATRATVVTKPAPVAAPAPQYVTPQPVVQQPVVQQRPVYTSTHNTNPVSQQQPAVTVPAAPNWNTPQRVNPQKRAYPIMPGQNRGLRNRKATNMYY